MYIIYSFFKKLRCFIVFFFPLELTILIGFFSLNVCDCFLMVAADGPQANSMSTPRLRTFADMVLDSPQPIPEVAVPFRPHKNMEDEVCVVFSKDELDQLALPFQFSLVSKFLRQRPSFGLHSIFHHNKMGHS